MADFFAQLEDLDPFWTQQNVVDDPYAPINTQLKDIEMRSSPHCPLSSFQPIPNESLEVERPLVVTSDPPYIGQDGDQNDAEPSFDPLGDELNAMMDDVLPSDDNPATTSTIQASSEGTNPFLKLFGITNLNLMHTVNKVSLLIFLDRQAST